MKHISGRCEQAPDCLYCVGRPIAVCLSCLSKSREDHFIIVCLPCLMLLSRRQPLGKWAPTAVFAVNSVLSKCSSGFIRTGLPAGHLASFGFERCLPSSAGLVWGLIKALEAFTVGTYNHATISEHHIVCYFASLLSSWMIFLCMMICCKDSWTNNLESITVCKTAHQGQMHSLSLHHQ